MRNDKENIIVTKTFDFALDIIEFSQDLYEAKRFPLANQIFKSGTSIGANVREAQNAEGKADFIHKLKIAAKEADETEYWLLLCLKISIFQISKRKINLRFKRNYIDSFKNHFKFEAKIIFKLAHFQIFKLNI